MVVYRKEPSELEAQLVTTATHDHLNNDSVEKSGVLGQSLVSRAVLISRPNSHPFQERHLALDQPVKIGRSVARCKAATNNAIFDCKVLSRNHALLWYENGKFYLQDTKSSNGTFVNNQRLSKSSEESQPREICSGDIVQFGVDVVENSRKVTHGCIISTIKLFLPDGKEAKASPTIGVSPTPCGPVSLQDLYQLAQYVQEALHREQLLENKLMLLRQAISSTHEASDHGWQAFIDEDRLLSRIETLEGQLQTCTKNLPEEKLREDCLKMQEEKDKYQNVAKESLRKVLQEKLEAVLKLQDLERTLEGKDEECVRLKEVYEDTQKEISLLASKTEGQLDKICELQQKMLEYEEREKDESTKCEKIKDVGELIEKDDGFLKKIGTITEENVCELGEENGFEKEQQEVSLCHDDSGEKNFNANDSTDGSSNNESNLQNNSSEKISQYADLKDECSSLRSRLQFIQAELQKYKNENVRLTADCKLWHESCAELEEAKRNLENQTGSFWKEQCQKVSQDLEISQEKFVKSQDEVVLLKECFAKCSDEKTNLQKEFNALNEEYKTASVQVKMVSTCSILPLFMLLIAFLLAFYPTISRWTGTEEKLQPP